MRLGTANTIIKVTGLYAETSVMGRLTEILRNYNHYLSGLRSPIETSVTRSF